MAECGVLLLVHGEVTDPEVDMFDREAVFIQTKLVRKGVGLVSEGKGEVAMFDREAVFIETKLVSIGGERVCGCVSKVWGVSKRRVRHRSKGGVVVAMF
jgi:dihydroorotase